MIIEPSVSKKPSVVQQRSTGRATAKPVAVLKKRLYKSLVTRGFLGTLLLCVLEVLRLIGNLAPSRLRARARQKPTDTDFDRQYGVDTSGFIPMSHLEVGSPNWVYGVQYQPIGASVFKELLAALDVAYEEFTFVDLGSGKGRAILLASALPFKQIIGVEFAEELHRIAEDNVRRYPDEAKKCKDIRLVCMDASEYGFPEGPFVLYMYNPFERPVMARVVENVVADFRKCPRRILVLYFAPRCSDLWDAVEGIRERAAKPQYRIYEIV